MIVELLEVLELALTELELVTTEDVFWEELLLEAEDELEIDEELRGILELVEDAIDEGAANLAAAFTDEELDIGDADELMARLEDKTTVEEEDAGAALASLPCTMISAKPAFAVPSDTPKTLKSRLLVVTGFILTAVADPSAFNGPTCTTELSEKVIEADVI